MGLKAVLQDNHLQAVRHIVTKTTKMLL